MSAATDAHITKVRGWTHAMPRGVAEIVNASLDALAAEIARLEANYRELFQSVASAAIPLSELVDDLRAHAPPEETS